MWKHVLMVALAGLVGSASAVELEGFIGFDTRSFWNVPAFPEQRNDLFFPSLLVQPEIRQEWNEGQDRLAFVPFFRAAPLDVERQHFDVRELSWLHSEQGWDLRAGVSRVFWGVTESQHLVDIINQTDFVEDIDQEDKLGQPMVNVNLLRDWGTVSLFVLPGFRERTFPGRRGRLRFALPVDTSDPVYESSLEEWHTDLAVRWSRAIGSWDLGIAHFWGTSREPRLVPTLIGGNAELVPHYDLIHQTSVDLQRTWGDWLWKLESLTREGNGHRFAAVTAGTEYTFTGVLESPVDIGVLTEYLYDGRNREAPPTPYDNDMFVGVRLVANDVQNSELLAGAVVDLGTGAHFISVEANRRIGERWKLEVELRLFDAVPFEDILYGVRKDDYVQVRLARYF
jgi:hypothetical protein